MKYSTYIWLPVAHLEPFFTLREMFQQLSERSVLMLKNWRYEIDIIAYIKKSVLNLSL